MARVCVGDEKKRFVQLRLSMQMQDNLVIGGGGDGHIVQIVLVILFTFTYVPPRLIWSSAALNCVRRGWHCNLATFKVEVVNAILLSIVFCGLFILGSHFEFVTDQLTNSFPFLLCLAQSGRLHILDQFAFTAFVFKTSNYSQLDFEFYPTASQCQNYYWLVCD